MASSFRSEDKLNNAANFKGMHLYMIFKLYHLEKHECILKGMYKIPCSSSDIGFTTFIGASS
jgi:hypothetical protein